MKKLLILSRLIYIFFFLIFFGAIEVLAQSSDGSADGSTVVEEKPPESPGEGGVTSDPTLEPETKPDPVYSEPVISPTTPSIRPTTTIPKSMAPNPSFVEPPVEIVSGEPVINEEENDSLDFLPIAMAGGLVLGLLGFFGLKIKKQEKKKNNKKCGNFKQLMEDKLNEFKDLESQLADFAKDKVEENIKNKLSERGVGNILVQVENAKKEYERFKKLYEECIADIGRTGGERLSYLMGAEMIKDEDLKNLGVKIETKSPKGHFMVKIPEEKLAKYVELVKAKLSNGFWNEIVGEKEIIYVFKFKDGHIEEYKLSDNNEKQIDSLCGEFINEPAKEGLNVYGSLSNNEFYRDFIIKHYKDKIKV